ncbi:hypothetical protein BEL04_18080 [Mucilaginibacter sp. PPCGB 2223]|uniref:WG repeat-containing protein n=1 Tax=Mucilaginibacter sp. PPCGB 2223 TaxID=1886027 RepID=UPI000824AD45|nr:WG repeat-containing protein [Mucilaginibacter sp. PPCGB 2223]OCX51911.1 hypothetical protein BEL04_18080 [Mucilaginibacter sp. PPCGB 2223]
MKLKHLISCTLFTIVCYTANTQPKIYTNLKPGDIAPDAVKIEADYIEGMINGVCLVRKGNAAALVDIEGHFVAPWGKYEIAQGIFLSVPFTRLIPAKDTKTGRFGYISPQGATLIPFTFSNAYDFDCHGVGMVGIGAEPFVNINTSGQRLPTVKGRTYILSEREPYNYTQSKLIRFPAGDNYGYADKNGKIIIPAQYQNAEEFTDGMAAVMKVDKFGVARWGYIDQTGKLVIPYTYQIQSGQFHNGLALVCPVRRETFNYAYIDKKGTVKFTVGDGRNFSGPNLVMVDGIGKISTGGLPHEASYFVNGYAFWHYSDDDTQLLDTLGHFHKIADILHKPEKYSKDIAGIQFDGYNDLGIFFKVNPFIKTENKHGMMNYKGEVIFPPSFLYIRPDYYSQYAVAGMSIPNGQNQFNSTLNGVVNRQGVFVLTLTKPSNF